MELVSDLRATGVPGSKRAEPFRTFGQLAPMYVCGMVLEPRLIGYMHVPGNSPTLLTTVRIHSISALAVGPGRFAFSHPHCTATSTVVRGAQHRGQTDSYRATRRCIVAHIALSTTTSLRM